jgi:hypothetical protein
MNDFSLGALLLDPEGYERRRMAQAKLHDAAPDMVAALQAVSNQARPRALVAGGKCAEYIIDRAVMEQLRSALAKAGL